MSAEALYEMMRTQRAIRRLKSDPIPDDVMHRILTAASWAPSGGNQQPWRIVLVRDAAKKKALGDMYGALWEKFAAMYRKRFEGLSPEEQAKEERTIAAGDYLCAHFHALPAVAIFCFNPKMMAVTDAKQDRVSVVGGGSVYPAVQNLMLACRAEGVGCVLTTLLCQVEPDVKALLDMPEDWYTCAAVPMGYPVGGGYGPIKRRAAGELCFEDGWKTPLSL